MNDLYINRKDLKQHSKAMRDYYRKVVGPRNAMIKADEKRRRREGK